MSSGLHTLSSEGAEREFYSMLMQAPVAIVVVSGPDYVVEFANDLLLPIAGKTRQELVGKPAFEVVQVPEADRDNFLQVLNNVRQSAQPLRAIEHPTIIERDGRTDHAFLNIVYQPVKEPDGTVNKIMVTVNEVTEQVFTRRKLESSEEQFRLLANSIPQLAWITDANGMQQYASKRWEEYTGLEPVGTETWQQIVHTDDMPLIAKAWSESMSTGGAYKAEARLKSKTGEFRWHFVQGEPVKNDDGKIVKWIGAFTDVHEQKTFAEKLETQVASRTAELEAKNLQLQNAQSFLQQLIDSSVEYISVLDKNLNYLAVNRQFEIAMGASRSDLVGKNTFAVNPEAEGTLQHECLLKALSGETVYLDKRPAIARPDFYVDTYFIPLTVQNRVEGVIIQARDVTNIVRAEKMLEQKNHDLASYQNFLQTVLNSSVELVAVIDKNGRYTFINRKLEELMGMTNAEVVGKLFTDMHTGIEETAVYQQLQRAFAGEKIHIEQRRAFTRKETVFETYMIPLIDNNEIIGVVTLQRDITPMVQLTENLEKTNRELQRSNDDLQQFAHVASHDLKEPVRKIMTFANRIRIELEGTVNEKAVQYLSRVEAAASRMHTMITGVLLYSSMNAMEQNKEVVNLNETLKSIESDLELVIAQKDALIEYGDMPSVEGSGVLIYQLFYNLINNSLKFSVVDRRPLITLQAVIATQDEVKNSCLDVSRSYVAITLRDNGIGFNNADAEKIFGSFKRLHAKDKYEGTGLGLSLCKNIAERHGGRIYATGKEGEGALFTVLLPE